MRDAHVFVFVAEAFIIYSEDERQSSEQKTTKSVEVIVDCITDLQWLHGSQQLQQQHCDGIGRQHTPTNVVSSE